MPLPYASLHIKIGALKLSAIAQKLRITKFDTRLEGPNHDPSQCTFKKGGLVKGELERQKSKAMIPTSRPALQSWPLRESRKFLVSVY